MHQPQGLLGTPFNPILPPILAFPTSQETTHLLSVIMDQILFSRICINRILQSALLLSAFCHSA